MADGRQVGLFHTPILLITAYVFAAYYWLRALIFGNRTPHSISISPSDDIDGHFESQSLSNEELFRLKIVEHNYVEALLIAEKNDFPTDDVYKAQFLEEPLSSRLIDCCLARIQDYQWTVKQILKKVSNDADVYFSIFNLGLKITNDNPDFGNDRAKILNFIDRLDDYQEMNVESEEEFNNLRYMEVRHFTCLEFACHLAAQNEFKDLKLLLKRRSSELLEFWLIILDNIPEITSVESYNFLLPLQQNLSSLWGESIAKELDTLFESRDQDWKRGPDFRLNNKERFCRSLLIDWYKHRTLTIESFTGLPDLAENFIEFVVRNTTFNELSLLKDDMNFLRLFTYARYHDKYTGYENFVALSPFKVAEEFIAKIDAKDLGSAFFDFILPYFQHYTRRYSRGSNVSSLFEASLVSLSKTSLKALHSFVIYTTKVGGIHKLDDFFSTNSNQTADFLLNLVEKCFEVCANENFDQMIDDGFDIANKIADLCDFLVAQNNITGRIMKNLQVLRMLNSLNIQCDYCKMKQISRSPKETAQLFKRLAKQFVNEAVLASKNSNLAARNRTQVSSSLLSKAKISLDTEYWKLSIEKLNEIRTLAFESVLDERDCTKFLVEFMLNSSDYHLIQVASNFLALENVNDRDHTAEDKLTFCESLQLILHCGLSYINESVNAEDKALLYAKQCFKLIKQDNIELIKKELDFLDAVQLLNSYGIKDLPLKLHLLEDKAQLIDRIFENDQCAYKDLSNLTSICRLLRIVGVDEKEIRIYALRRCADQALERQDQTICCEYCRKLVNLGDSRSWTVCQRLSKNLTSQPNPTLRLEFLRFCLLNCDSDSLMDVLADYLKAMNDQDVKREASYSMYNDLFCIEDIAERNFDGIEQQKVNVPIKLLSKKEFSDEFERSLSEASNLFNSGQFKKAGDVLLKAYHVPQAMATYNTVSYLIKKLKENM